MIPKPHQLFIGVRVEHVASKEQFSQRAAAAPVIFEYVATSEALRECRPLTFEYGMLDGQSPRAIAKFSCVNCSRCRKGVVWVTVTSNPDGSLAISHSFGTME